MSTNGGLVDYPVPLAGGLFAHLRLPADLTRADVDRMVAFLQTLVIEREATS